MTQRISDETRAEVVAAYVAGGKVEDIAHTFGISSSTVVKFADEAGVRRPFTPKLRDSSPAVLDERKGAWVYDSNGIARWTPGVVA